MKKEYTYWLGDEASFDTYKMVMQKSLDPDLLIKSPSQTRQEDVSHLLTQYGGVGVISIQGSLLPFSNWMTQMMGLTGYPDIREALVQAAENDSIHTILLDINSPGGAANGIEDISQLINQVKEVKPVISYTNSVMASAAYWIGATADSVYSSRMASVGSIGVIATHMEYTNALAADGITPRVFRAGEFKALGSPYEKLSAEAATIIQGKLDALYSEFVDHIAESRGTSSAIVHSKMADGREFLGHEALQAGLVDGNMSIDELMARLDTPQPTTVSRPRTRMEASDMKKKLLTPQTVAALEAGVATDVALAAAPDASEAEILAAAADTSVAPEASADVTPDTNVEEPAPVTAAAPAEPELVGYLKGELNTTTEKLMDATMQVKDLQAKLDTLITTHAQMRDIVISAVNTKRITLGGHSTDLSMVSDEGLLQLYSQASAEFSKHFPIGGVASLPSTEQATVVVPTPASRAQIKAVKISQ